VDHGGTRPIRDALHPYPDVVIATKVGPGEDADSEFIQATTPEQLRYQVEENLRRLGRDHLDLVNLTRHRVRAVLRDRRLQP